MTIVGFTFNKVQAERKAGGASKVNISNNVSVVDVKEDKLNLGSKQTALRIGYVFTSKFDPDIGFIEIQGTILYLADDNKDVLKDWKKDKALPKEIMQEVLNAALQKCNIEAIILARDLNLPSPVPLPHLDMDKKK